MRKGKRLPGFRLLIAVGAFAVLGLGAGAAVPDSASATGSGGGSQNICLGGTKSTTMEGGFVVQTCEITAAFGTCIQHSSAPLVRQRCQFTQTSPGTEKRAIAVQIHNPEGFQGTQDGTQVIEVIQSGTTKKNTIDALQLADQCLGAADRYEGSSGDRHDQDRDGDRDDDGRCEDEDESDNDNEERTEDLAGLSLPSTVEQKQEAHQSVDGYQTAQGNGRNDSKVLQSQHLHERAAKATGIVQKQNVEDRSNECNQSLVFEPSNACYTIAQTTENGSSVSRLFQVYNLFESARKTASGQQFQGSFEPFFGGLSHGFEQVNTGTAPAGTPIQSSSQNERMTQRRDDTGLTAFHQHGPLRKDVGNQFGANGGTANIRQDSVLSSTGGGTGNQTDLLDIECASFGGNCTGFQHARLIDDQRTVDKTNGPVTSPAISMTINCGNVYPPGEYGGPPPEECVATGGAVPLPD
jgi:hypothetical protein